ncbi:MAG: type II toxin-antitoxin system VapC family toxin [Spirochaetaceae bacterium]|nr:MAG: type II toxin-antitoxin system VapC family toxin [Spirochaetaceae bacterium]
MIVLDTNVLSEIMKPNPDTHVLSWVDSVPPRDIAITAITVAEILYGIGRLPDGSRLRKLMSAAAAVFKEDFTDRVLEFDADAAVEYAALVVEREAAGLSIPMADAQIAAVCRVQACTLATRNVRDFQGTGVTTVNPWNDDPYPRTNAEEGGRTG